MSEEQDTETLKAILKIAERMRDYPNGDITPEIAQELLPDAQKMSDLSDQI